MKRYIALLRAININGKNKIPMAELKKGFEQLAFAEVKTWLNSGNVAFSSSETDTVKLTAQIEKMVQDQFDLDIPVFVISQEKLEDILQHAPDWWGTENKEIYDNLIFIMPPAIRCGCSASKPEALAGAANTEHSAHMLRVPYK